MNFGSFFSDAVRRNPYPLYDQLRSSSPVLHVAPLDLWVLFDYENVRRALTDHEAFSSSVTPQTGKAPDWLIFLDPPRHTKLRGILTRAFTPRSIAELEPSVRQISAELLDEKIEQGQMDLAVDYASPLPTLVIAEMLGIPRADRPRFLRWSDAIMALSYSITGGEEAARAIREHAAVKEEIREYLSAMLEARRCQPTGDLLTRLISAEVDGAHLTEEEILGFFQLLLAAGSETTANLITNGILALVEHPQELARLRATPSLLPSAIEEIVRHRSPGQIMFRSTRREVELHGQTIPAGKFVLVMIGSANRDPKVFPQADRFDIARDPNPHIGFGHGVHFCLGAALSRLEGRVALGDLLDRLQGLELASSEPWEPRKALNMHGPARLPLRFAPGPRRS